MPDKCPENCPVLPRVESLEEANKQHSSTHREIFKRLGDMERASDVHENRLEGISEKLDEIQADQKNILKKVEALEQKPARRWDSLVEKAIWAIAAAVIAFLLARVGL